MAKQKTTKSVEALIHDEAKRKNIPTAEYLDPKGDALENDSGRFGQNRALRPNGEDNEHDSIQAIRWRCSDAPAH